MSSSFPLSLAHTLSCFRTALRVLYWSNYVRLPKHITNSIISITLQHLLIATDGLIKLSRAFANVQGQLCIGLSQGFSIVKSIK